MDADSQDFVEEVIAEEDEEVAKGFLHIGIIPMLIMGSVLYVIWREYISPRLEDWKARRADKEEEMRLKKNPDIFKEREAARMAAVERMQEKYYQDAIIMKKKMEEKAEKKRQEFIERNSNVGGRRLNEDYNPLLGKSGPSYRTSRRSCPGGSCGNK